MHPRGFIHRDIKGENVLVDEEGHVMLADFGVTAAMEPRPTSPRAGSSSPSGFEPSSVSAWCPFCTVHDATVCKFGLAGMEMKPLPPTCAFEGRHHGVEVCFGCCCHILTTC